MTPTGPAATDLLASFAAGRLSPVDVAKALLDEADEAGRRFRHIVAIDRKGVLAAASESEHRWREGRPRPLEGLPFALKGMIPDDGSLVRRVVAQGAYVQCIVVPFGYGTPVNVDSDTQPLNPADPSRMPGGSSTARVSRWPRGTCRSPSARMRPARSAFQPSAARCWASSHRAGRCRSPGA